MNNYMQEGNWKGMGIIYYVILVWLFLIGIAGFAKVNTGEKK